MNKKIIALLSLCILTMFIFCACDSEEVKQAKEDFAAGHYTEVVKTLDGQENLSQEAQDMLAISEANVAYENEDYLVAVKTLTTASTGIQTEQFEEMFNAALEDAIANKDSDAIVELLALDDSKADAVYDAVTKACTDKDYNGFQVLDGLVEKLSDGDLKSKLTDLQLIVDHYRDVEKQLKDDVYEIARLEKVITGLQDEIDKLNADKRTLEGEIASLNGDVAEHQKKIAEREKEIEERKKINDAADALKKNDEEGLLRDIANELKAEYRDFIDSENDAMDEQLGEIYREKLRNIFKILAKKGIRME